MKVVSLFLVAVSAGPTGFRPRKPIGANYPYQAKSRFLPYPRPQPPNWPKRWPEPIQGPIREYSDEEQAKMCSKKVVSGAFIGEPKETRNWYDTKKKDSETEPQASVEIPESPVQNQIRTIFILDETGSMLSKQEDYKAAYNKFLEAQKEIQATDDNPEPKYTLIKFATELEILKNSKISEAEELTSKNYSPSGGTALYDAIGCTVSVYRDEKFNNLVILTDGEENSSRIYSQDQIKKLIEKIQGDDFGWSVDYLAANQDAFASGSSIGLSRASIQPYSANTESINQNFMMLGQKIQQKRVSQNLALKNYYSQAQNLN